ncbi:MAG: hypothetical protein ACOYKZ_07395 [Chlamydiia bacterium]
MNRPALRPLDRKLRQQQHPLLTEYRFLRWIHAGGLQDRRLATLRMVALRTAEACLGPKGEFLVERAQELIAGWSQWAVAWPDITEGIEPFFEQMRDSLGLLVNDRALRVLLMGCSKPSHLVESDQRIRLAAGLWDAGPVTDRIVRVAVLSALLTPLRQSVGSCFATAPAILIQREDPGTLLDDLRQLLDTGRLERTAGGETSAVPISLRWSSGLVLRPIPIVAQLFNDPGLLRAAQVAGLLPAAPLHVQRARWRRLLTPYLGEKISIQELLSRMIAADLGLEWPLATMESASGGDLMLPARVARQLRLQETYDRRIDAATQAFASIEHHPLLKTWEYTLASFTEARPQWSAHNLWTSLGLSSKDPESLGGHFTQELQAELDRLHEEHQHFVTLTEAARARHMSAQSQSAHIRSESDARRVSGEARSAQRDYDYASGNLAQIQERSEVVAELPQRFAQDVERLMPRYFQEAYDPALQGQTESIFDDTPAGFRLIFKGGVEAVRAWTWIQSPAQYLQAMREFLDRVFVELRDTPDLRVVTRDLLDLSHSTSLFLDQPAFLEGSLKRLAEAHGRPLPKHPLQHLDQCSYKPWAYESGGTLMGLVKHYFALTESPVYEEKRCERAADLVAFMVETLRALPEHVLNSITQPPSSLLAFSPTHAFLVQSGRPQMAEALQSGTYSYTLLTEQWMDPMEAFYRSCSIVPGEALDRLIDGWVNLLPPKLQGAARLSALGFNGSMSPMELYGALEQSLDQQLKQLDLTPRLLTPLEGLLVSRLPFIPEESAAQALQSLFPELNLSSAEGNHDLTRADQRIRWVHLQSFLQDRPLTRTQICERLRKGGLLAPQPFIWADSNWPFYFFALMMSPGRGVPALWRMDDEGVYGTPMTEWQRHLQPGNENSWGLLNRPGEYRHRVTSLRALGPRHQLFS